MARNNNTFGPLSTCDVCGTDVHTVYARTEENYEIERCRDCEESSPGLGGASKEGRDR